MQSNQFFSCMRISSGCMLAKFSGSISSPNSRCGTRLTFPPVSINHVNEAKCQIQIYIVKELGGVARRVNLFRENIDVRCRGNRCVVINGSIWKLTLYSPYWSTERMELV